MPSQCPKCHQAVNAELISCPACGIVFAKYYRYHPPGETPLAAEQRLQLLKASQGKMMANDEVSPLSGLLIQDVYQESQGYFFGRCLILLIFGIWSIVLINVAFTHGNDINNAWLHSVNLPFHEAGHLVFRPFGHFIMSLGGSLGQLIMPLICLFTLLIKTGDAFGASIACWWFGENFLDISPYVNDARAGVMPLLGSNFGHSAPYGFHDWNYLLNESGLLEYDHALASLACWLGSLVMLLALGWALVIVLRQRLFLAEA